MVCLEVKDVIFETIDFVQTKDFLGYQCLSRCTRFLVLSHKDVQDFFEFHLKLNFFFYYPSFSKILEPLPLGSLRQWLNWPSGRVALHGLSKFRSEERRVGKEC